MEIPEKFAKHIQPSGLNSKFEYENLNFEAYLTAVNTMLKSVNTQFQLEQTEEHIDANSPFEFRPKKPTKTGALLVHGLFDTPFIMRDVGKHLCQQGLLVRSVLLTGHGTIPADLLTTSTKEWDKAIRYGVDSFTEEVDQLYLVGFSTGAALELNYVLEHQNDKSNIAGLIMLCPAMAINTKKSIFLRIYRMIRWLFKEQKWIFRNDNPDYTKYTSFPVNSGYLVQRVIVENMLLLKKHQCTVPVFIAMSEDDETVRTEVTLKFFETTPGKNNRCILYSKHPRHYSDPRITVVNSQKLDEHILDMSHTCVPISPDNYHYGKHGDFQERLSEPNKRPIDNTIYFGATTPENEQRYRLRRLSYNPFFNELMQSIDEFIRDQKP
jgi:esterase/lipase